MDHLVFLMQSLFYRLIIAKKKGEADSEKCCPVQIYLKQCYLPSLVQLCGLQNISPTLWGLGEL